MMGRAILWIAHFAYYLIVHRGNVSNAAWATEHEMGAWK